MKSKNTPLLTGKANYLHSNLFLLFLAQLMDIVNQNLVKIF